MSFCHTIILCHKAIYLIAMTLKETETKEVTTELLFNEVIPRNEIKQLTLSRTVLLSSFFK